MKVLDCTIRDGGYYTNWDFDKELIDTYINSINELPIDLIEVGYRSKEMSSYLGQYFYCPTYVLEEIRRATHKKIVIILNEKDVRVEDVDVLLTPCVGLVDMVRLAIDPKNISRAIELATEIKKKGFEVGFNVMYMSNWKNYEGFINLLENVNDVADVFYMVDSFGGVYPEDVREIYGMIKEKLTIPIGFHGHNNLELGLINTLVALDCGVEYVDATITGMGRGAGNLKMELLLTALNSKGILDVDFNALSRVVAPFELLKEKEGWGTSLPYMVSGANSLPQKEVMEWMSKRYYSLNSIIRALNNQSAGKADNHKLDEWNPSHFSEVKEVLLIGGGPSVKRHIKAIKELVKDNKDILLLHASSKYANLFEGFPNRQIFCLMGNEGHRLEDVFGKRTIGDATFLLPPYPRKMGTYIPKIYQADAVELSQFTEISDGAESQTAMAMEVIKKLRPNKVDVIGYDGYAGGSISRKDRELFVENEALFLKAQSSEIALFAITPTLYESLKSKSIYHLV